MAELRAAGTDPSRGREAAKRRAALAHRKQEEAAWETENGGAEVDQVVYVTETLPKLQASRLR